MQHKLIHGVLSLKKGLHHILEHPSIISAAIRENPWWNEFYIRTAILNIMLWLDKKQLMKFSSQYPSPTNEAKRIGIIMAGNIPLVGMHDLITTLLSGHKAIVKLSHKDSILWNALYLQLSPYMQSRIRIVPRLNTSQIDFLLATGSDNTARHLAASFSNTPKLIRKNRFAVGVIEGNETHQELSSLLADIYLYNGMGCRNISNLIIPQTYDLSTLEKILESWPQNYLTKLYRDAVKYLAAKVSIIQNQKIKHAKILCLEQKNLSSAQVGTLHVVRYKNSDELKTHLDSVKTHLQCIVGKNYQVKFGQTQIPELGNFADGVDTMQLMASL